MSRPEEIALILRFGMRYARVFGLVLGVCAACGGGADEEGDGGPGGSGGSGGASESALAQFCEARGVAVAEACGEVFNVERCKAGADCGPMLLNKPGDPLFECLLDSGCGGSCLVDLYGPGIKLTPTGEMFGMQCSAKKMEGCALFEDLCLAGALFTDEALKTMGACFDLPACEEVQACIDASYMRCTAWVYPILE